MREQQVRVTDHDVTIRVTTGMFTDPTEHVELYVENWGDPRESSEVNLTPAEARRVAAMLTAMADAVEAAARGETTDGE